MSAYICNRDTREALPYRDFTLKCTDGDVKVHMSIMLLQSHTFKDAVCEGGMCSEFKMPYSTSVVEHALDYIYGSAYYVGDKKTNTIPLELYNVFAMLQTDHLLNYKYYNIHDFSLDSYTHTNI